MTHEVLMHIYEAHLVCPRDVLSHNLIVPSAEHDNAAVIRGQDHAVPDAPSRPCPSHPVSARALHAAHTKSSRHSLQDTWHVVVGVVG